MNIYVGNLPYSVADDQLQDLFAQHGTVSRVNVVMDRETGRPRGFAFVEMANEAEGQAAIDAINGVQLGGRALTANVARAREERGGGARGRRW
ncbi:MAG: RNA-binding protein [Planctomycetes bacterium]|nr:RNA-binding protein [Planctomycetota bacterium]MCW8141748.1 RNA-binding protein [Planctomycetota bacterium]